MSEKVDLLLDIHDKPKPNQWFLLSFQHVFAMFGATVLVPLLTGFPVSVALFASGVGTLIYYVITAFKVPIYLGSSFAYISATIAAVSASGGDYGSALSGLVLVGLCYAFVSIIIKLFGTNWIDFILPPIVIGPMVVIIGLGLSSVAVNNSGLIVGADLKHIFVALFTFVATAIFITKAKGILKLIPFLAGIILGYIVAVALNIVDYSSFNEVLSQGKIFALPEFLLPFKFANFKQYEFKIDAVSLSVVPVFIVTIAEHIGDHTVLSKICGRNFLKDPGLHRTILGDGIATSFSALIGGPANTSYGENTGVIGMTKVASIYVTAGAAIIAILLSFLPIISAFITSIPNAVIGGMSIILYGCIASNGLKILIDHKVDFSKQRNLVIASAMLVIGIGGAILPLGNIVSLSGTALSGIVGVILNQILPKE